jgi:hypothetical protein
MASDGDFPRVESLTYAFVALDPDHDDFSQTKPARFTLGDFDCHLAGSVLTARSGSKGCSRLASTRDDGQTRSRVARLIRSSKSTAGRGTPMISRRQQDCRMEPAKSLAAKRSFT